MLMEVRITVTLRWALTGVRRKEVCWAARDVSCLDLGGCYLSVICVKFP